MLAAIAVASYSIAACAFLLLFILLLLKWRGRRHGAVLTFACFVTALWAISIVYFTKQGVPAALPVGILEMLRNAMWSAFLLGVVNASFPTHTVMRLKISKPTASYASIYMLLIIAAVLSYAGFDFVDGIAGSMSFIGMAVVGMILTEQLFRNTPGKARWGIKYACLGIGGLFAYDFYFYVDALLFRRVNVEIWTARGFINAFAVPLIAVSAARNPEWSVGIAVSRRILFHSATLFGSAIYLLVVAAAGYYLRFFGGDWGTVLQVTLLVSAIVLLIAVLFSGTFRSWLKVSISKHFYNYGYDYREEWLNFIRTLSVEGPQLGERVVRAIAHLVESPKGILYTSNGAEQYVATAEWNLTFRSDPEDTDSALCIFLKRKQWVIDLQEFDADPAKYDGLVIPEWLRNFPQAWLVVPLIENDDLFGFVVLAKSRSKITLNWEVTDLLKIVGKQAASYLARQESANALAVARQFETFNRMSTFVVHDLKNLVSQLALLLANAEKHKESPEFQKDMLETIDHAVHKMRGLLQKFNRDFSTERSGRVLLENVLERAIASKSGGEPRPHLDIRASGMAVSGNSSRLERVIGHLIQNAIEATPREGRIDVRLMEDAGNAVVEIADTGKGMNDQFIRGRLFKPFESTKSAGMGIGVFETREYILQIGGRLEVSSRPSEGTTFRVSLPLYGYEEDKMLSTT
ncbi:MAG TPA: XrtA/PEP-CTERM system histidine kinase PrsK [Noviherbaspirillum sp.]|jgi:putative PEP-CTERM system histidine kinase|uniref:XrtA/PEP-CTERM system histidine kinase PrsK n=1 Tax=Noviherbaspirillum sp. TaxID=1926288 RepID=UPI002DDCF43A|nr:XrtA/PEP-CTERM system histidine kinase PrsK [Noviherbaspirillum sp.]HEV2610012.1 XrtA/PEP-CTERM system histidine kinase PrsK [Noviherbaspirillum sp.]